MKSNLTRRAALAGVASLATAGLPIAQAAPLVAAAPAVAASAASDPVYMAIMNYRFGMGLFELIAEKDWEKAGGEQAVIDGTYGPPLEVLGNWEGAATTREGAIEALQFVANECELFFASPTIRPMVLAALGYLENFKA